MSNPSLERERKKLLWLRNKLVDQERWVAELERRERDPLDDLFEMEAGIDDELDAAVAMAADVEHVEVQTPAQVQSEESSSGSQVAQYPIASGPWGGWTRPARRLPANWLAILKFIGGNGASAAQVRNYIEEHKLLSWDTARAGLMNYRRDFGLLESPKRGYYRLTDKGLETITATENESPASGEASESQPTTQEVALST